jgi:putative membrane protein
MHLGTYGYGIGYGMGLAGIIMVIFWISVISLIAYVVSSAVHGRRRSGNAACSETPLDIAKGRYARGEITRDDFERLRSDLMKG